MSVALYGICLTYLVALAPAAITCCFKERWTMFILGWITFGLTWIVGAQAAVSRRTRGITALAALGAILVLGAFGSRPAPVLGLDGETLESSVGNGIWFYNFKSCGHLRDGSWSCGRWDAQFSSTVSYRVEVDALGCWHATLVGSRGEGAPSRLSGCVHLGDYVL